jgi:stage II sporulation protein D
VAQAPGREERQGGGGRGRLIGGGPVPDLVLDREATSTPNPNANATTNRPSTAALVLLLAASPARAAEVVRIAVVSGAERVTVEAAGLTLRPLRDGAAPEAVASGRAELALEGDALTVNGEPLDAAGAVFGAEGGVMAAGIALQGEVEVRRAPGGLAAIDVLPLEDYVAAVTGAEMPPGFPPEALRAQAVAARTFAVFKKLEALQEGRPWHLGATVLDQVYRGARVDPRARAAAEATAGEVLVFEHAPVEAYFHAACGGHTERGLEALERDRPYLASVRCEACRGAPGVRWTVRVPAAELGRVAGLGAAATRVRVASRTASGRAARVEVAAGTRKVALGAVDLRQRLGFARLPSLAFDAAVEGGAAVFRGHGRGHGAGMCQWGAAGLARAGEGWRAILARYYPGSEVRRMY